jgi:hypothetical protein
VSCFPNIWQASPRFWLDDRQTGGYRFEDQYRQTLVFTDSLSLAWFVVIGKLIRCLFQGSIRPGLRGLLRRLFRCGGGPIGEGHGPAASDDRGHHVIEALVIFRGVIQFELRTETQVKIVDGFDASNQTFAC